MSLCRYKQLICTLFAGFLCIPAVNTTASEGSQDTNLKTDAVNVEQGFIRGVHSGEVSRYLGIPFAKPPVGELRWRPPQDVQSWGGVREMDAFGSACAQHGNFYTSNNPIDFDRPYGSEDCLYLNVWAPEKRSEKRPVLVFIHGGSGIHGAASLPLYNGERLAKELDAIFVSINYRLGSLGNMNMKALRQGDPAGDSGSFALLDQIKALEWVQQNISEFGGDGNNITLMGHSAGCGSIWDLMRSPLAAGRFQKSICLSGIITESSEKEVTQASHDFLSHLLVSDGLIESADELEDYLGDTTEEERRSYLYGKSTEEIVNASEKVSVAGGFVDGYVITAREDGPLVNPVPSIIGTTDNEAPLLLLGSYSKKNYTKLWKLIHSDGQLAQRDLFNNIIDFTKFKLAAWIAEPALISMVDEASELLESSSVPVFRYRFDWKNTPEPWRSLIGSYHGIDVPFIFGNFEVDTPSFTNFTWLDSDQSDWEKIHTRFAKSLRGFVESGNPNKYSSSLEWPLWAGDDTEVIID